eukprot:gene2199-96_t
MIERDGGDDSGRSIDVTASDWVSNLAPICTEREAMWLFNQVDTEHRVIELA